MRAIYVCGTAALLFTGTGCDSVVEPGDQFASVGTDVRTVRQANSTPPSGAPFNILSEHDRTELSAMLRQSLATATPERAAHLRETIELLGKPVNEIVLGSASDVSRNVRSESSTLDVNSTDSFDSGPILFTTYMNFTQNPDGRGYNLVGATNVTTDGAYARIKHQIFYSIGNSSYTYTDDSGIYTRVHSSWIPIDCGQPTTINATTNSSLTWGGNGGQANGHGTLGTRDCSPRTTWEEDVVQPADGGGTCNGTGCEDNFPTAYEWCVIRYTYYQDTGEIISSRLLYCY